MPFFRHKELHLKKYKLGVTVDPADASRSTVVMRRLLIETMRLNHIRSITDGGLSFVHIARVKRRVYSS